MKKKLVLLLLFLASISYGQTEKIIISGTITDSKGVTLPGVTVSTSKKSVTISDLDGNYSIPVSNSQEIIKFSFIGYLEQTITVGVNKTIDVILQLDNKELQEVVVTGYGTQRKKDVTGAITSIKVKDMLAIPTTSVAEMMRGRVAGVQVTIGSSRPGSGSDILIRGKRSLSGGNSPLFVVDGSPVTDIDDLNANDIKSVEVLKDASAQAIYGARASAGVILVTTNRGFNGKTQIDFNTATSFQNLKKNFSLMSGTEWIQMILAGQNDFRPLADVEDYVIEAAIGDPMLYNNYLAGKSTNWEKELIKPAQMKSYNLSIKGGGQSTKYSTSFNYTNQEGMITNSGYERLIGRVNLDQTISNNIKMGTNISYTRSTLNGEDGITNGSSGSSNMYRKAFTFSPYSSPYDASGAIAQFVTTDLKFNPIWNSQQASDKRLTTRLLVNVFADWQITKGLKYRINTSYNSRNENRESYESSLHERGRPVNGWGQLKFGNDTEWLVENILNYNKDINETNRFDVTLMQSVNQFRNEGFTQTAQNFLTDFFGVNGFNNASVFGIPNRSISNRQIQSYLGRFRFTLFEKYILAASYRYDGSSVFGKENKWGLFPSYSAAWKINEESFLKDSKIVNNLKLRVSYGEVGNQGIGAYQTTSNTSQSEFIFGPGPGYSVGLLPGNVMPNPFLKWENSATQNVGVDFGFFNDRVSGSIELYNTKTTDLLIYKTLQASSGYSSQLTNLGEVQNKGIEIQLTTEAIKTKDFTMGVNLTFSKNRNEIISIDGKLDANGNPLSQPNNNWFIGKPIDCYFEYRFDGIFNNIEEVRASAQGKDPAGVPLSDAELLTKVGSIRVKDINGDGIINEAGDKDIINATPDWIGSLSTNFNYKGISLLLDFYTVQGIVRNNSFLYDFNDGGTNSGKLNGIKRDYWTPDGLGQEAPMPRTNYTDPFVRSMGIQDASYIRLRTISLGYTLPKIKWMGKENKTKIYIYGTATNYFTWTKYQSFSPESNPSSYPEPKMLTFGVNVSL
jgi:TonB-linked SusC/RagA family outer membrane protein